MKKGCLPGFSFVGGPRDKERILVTIKINVFRPATGLAVPLTSSDHSRALGGGRDEVGLGSSFYLLAAAATTKSGPRK